MARRRNFGRKLPNHLAAGSRRRLNLERLEDRRLLAITVTTHLDVVDLNDGVTSLREAIFAANTANGADTIDFAPLLTANGPSTILLTQGELAITEALTIEGPGSSLLTIDAQQQSRIFNITATSGDFAIEGLSLTNGLTTGDNVGSQTTFSGGAIRSNSSGLLVLRDSTVKDSSTTGQWADGGGVFTRGRIRIVESTISGNRSAEGDGGGVSSDSDLVEVYRSTISRNEAAHIMSFGGGIATFGVLYVEDGRIIGNHAGNGGGLFGMIPRLLRSTVSGNTSADRGGGIWGYDMTVVRESTISGNSAQRIGGGIETRQATIEDSTISGNFTTASDDGGGGIRATQSLTVDRSTIVGNHTAGRGGGIWFLSGTGSIQHSVVASNTAAIEGDDVRGPTSLTARFSLIGNASGTNLAEAPVRSPDANGNLIGGSVNGVIDPKLGPLANNGGPTWTHALLVGSPAIDAGDPTVAAGMNRFQKYDQRGEPYGRTEDGDASGGARLDMGAFERQPNETFTLVVDTLDDENDGDYSEGDFSLREAIALANSNPGSDTIQFAAALTAGGPATILLMQGELAITESLTIDGPGSTLLTIDAQQHSRIFHITATIGDFLLRGLTLTGGRTTENTPMFASSIWCGGAIRSLTDGMLTLEEMIVSGNGTLGTRSSGGAIFTHAELTIRDSTLSGNFTAGSSANGGAVSSGRNLLLERTTISENWTISAPGGGVLGVKDVTLVECVVSQNAAHSTIGKIGGVHAGEKLTVVDSSLIDNIGEGARSIGDAYVLRSTVAGNSGIGIRSQESVTISQSTVSQNEGGIFADRNVSVSHSTITGNHATTMRAGGVYTFSNGTPQAKVTVSNSIIAGNSGEHASDVGGRTNQFDVRTSLIGDRTGTNLIEAPAGSPDANGNLIGGPVHGVIDPLLGPLVNNGGTTWTHALLPGSPALDAGDPAAIAGVDGVPEFDQRGGPWSRVVGGRIDMGAIEAQANPLPGDYNFNGIVDAADYTVWRDMLGSTNDLRADGSGAVVGVPDGVIDEHDYAYWKANFGNVLEQGAGSGEQGGSGIAASQRLAGEEVAVVKAAKVEWEGIWVGGDEKTAARGEGRRAVSPRLLGGSDGTKDGLLACVTLRDVIIDEEEGGASLFEGDLADEDNGAAALDLVFAAMGGGI